LFFRYLILFSFIYLIYRIFRSAYIGSPRDTDMTLSGEDMVNDPNCDTYIPKRSAIKAIIKGETLYFCSKECEREYSGKLRR
jgi:YHS domain-containing protein